MPKYYTTISDHTNLRHSTGSNAAIPPAFYISSATIISQSSFIQSLIQNIIYTSFGKDLPGATQTLRKFPNPKARVDFLQTYPYPEDDPILKAVFEFARGLFKDIYELRNVLTHEVWSSSDQYAESALFSSLEENARLLTISGRLFHNKETQVKEVYDATVRFIRNVKVVHLRDMERATTDLGVCSWSLMHMDSILKESDPDRKRKAREAFLVFRGTSHLFEGSSGLSKTVEYTSTKKAEISE